MYETKNHKVPNDDKHSRSSHALIDRALLKSMQTEINHASELIISLRDEKETLKKTLAQVQQENHEKNNIIRNLKNKIKSMERYEEDESIIKELNQANMKLKNEIELSLHGISSKTLDGNNEIISLTEAFLNKAHDKTKLYQIFKTHMKSSNNFKQIIGNENWRASTLLLLRFFKDLFTEEDHKVKIICPELNSDDDESEQENYKNLIQESKHLLDTLSYQKNKLENLNKEYSTRGPKISPIGSPIYRANLTCDKAISSADSRRDSSQHIGNFHTANRIAKNISKYKQIPIPKAK